MDDLGDRMKGYEAQATSSVLDASMPIYARLDGRSFSSFTRGMEKPFDATMRKIMDATAAILVEKTNPTIAYTQSDEISLVWDAMAPPTEPIFGGKVFKLTSVLASLATIAFAKSLHDLGGRAHLIDRLPHFDARVFNVPSRTEAANMFLWRCLDATKNAVASAAQAEFSPKQLHGKKQIDMRAMLMDKGIVFDSSYPSQKWETWLRRETFERAFTADELSKIPAGHRPAPDTLVTRHRVANVPIRYFVSVTNREDVIFKGASAEYGTR